MDILNVFAHILVVFKSILDIFESFLNAFSTFLNSLSSIEDARLRIFNFNRNLAHAARWRLKGEKFLKFDSFLAIFNPPPILHNF